MADDQRNDGENGAADKPPDDAEQKNQDQQSGDDQAQAKKEAMAKAKAAAKAGAGKDKQQQEASEEEDAGPEPLPDHFQELVDALAKQFPDVDFKPEFNAPDGHLYLQVPKERLVDVGTYLRDQWDLNYLRCLSGVDLGENLQTVYHLVPVVSDQQAALFVALQVEIDRTEASVPSVVDVWPTANWHEREAFDLLGIHFENHPDLRRILLPGHWQGGYPLRKDFVDKRPKKQRKVRPR